MSKRIKPTGIFGVLSANAEAMDRADYPQFYTQERPKIPLPEYADPKVISEKELEARLRISAVHTELGIECANLGAKARSGANMEEAELTRLKELCLFFTTFQDKWEEMFVKNE